jgi:hypothetical protein
MTGMDESIRVGALRSSGLCTACELPMRMFSLKHDVWVAIAPKSCYFCWECANKLAQVKLGRCLTEDDLKPGVPCNERFIARKRKEAGYGN